MTWHGNQLTWKSLNCKYVWSLYHQPLIITPNIFFVCYQGLSLCPDCLTEAAVSKLIWLDCLVGGWFSGVLEQTKKSCQNQFSSLELCNLLCSGCDCQSSNNSWGHQQMAAQCEIRCLKPPPKLDQIICQKVWCGCDVGVMEASSTKTCHMGLFPTKRYEFPPVRPWDSVCDQRTSS